MRIPVSLIVKRLRIITNSPIDHSEVAHSRARPWIGVVVLEMIVLSVALCAVPLALVLDSSVLGNGVSDSGATEVLQSAMLGLVIVSYGFGLRRHHDMRGYAIAAMTFFVVLLVREQDGILDAVFHGFWAYPAALITVLGAVATFVNRDTFWQPLQRHISSREAAFMLLGLVLLVFFSRIYGTGFVWETMMGDGYVRTVKNAVQEGIELMAYIILAFGAVISMMSGFGKPADT